jgi:membrane-bound ClpP family serine protease
MKAIRIITHPYTTIISFCMIMISGQHLGGFYLLYLLLALPHGGIHALLALFGVMLLLISYNKYKRKKLYLIENIINVIGIILLILSLYLFFYNDKEHYNYSTFYQLLPQITLIIFSIIAVVFLFDNLTHLFKNTTDTKAAKDVINY